MSKAFISVTEVSIKQLTHTTPITKLYNTKKIINTRATGSNCRIFYEGKFSFENRVVSETKATIDNLISNGYVDFVMPLTVKTLNGNAAAGSVSFSASWISEIYADPQAAGDSVVIVQEPGRSNDQVYIVDETLSAIQLLVPAFEASGSVAVDAAITALGVDNTDAYQLSDGKNFITGGAANTGVILPATTGGDTFVVTNLTASDKLVYPALLARIDDLTISTGGFTLKPEDVVVFRSSTSLLWQSDAEADSVYSTLYADTIAENTSGSGVTIDGLTILDGGAQSANQTDANPSANSSLKSGTTASADSGNVDIATGTVSALGKSGLVQIYTGTSTTSGDTGDITMTTGTSTIGSTGSVRFTTGNTASGVAGDILLTTGSHTSATVEPVIQLENGVVRKPLSSAQATGDTVTGPELVRGLLTVTGATGNLQLPTAVQISTAIGSTPAGTIVDFYINAVGMTATNVVTLLVGAGMTVLTTPIVTGSATLTVAQDVQGVGHFRLIYDTSTTCKLIRVS